MVKRSFLLMLTLASAMPNAGLMGMQNPAQQGADDVPPLIDEEAEQNDEQNQGQQGPECSICLEAMDANQPNTIFHLHQGHPHRHSFHTACIARAALRDPRCPICRRAITGPELAASLNNLNAEEANKLRAEAASRLRKKVVAGLLVLGTSIGMAGSVLGSYYYGYRAWREPDNEKAVALFKKAIKLSFLSGFLQAGWQRSSRWYLRLIGVPSD